MQWADLDATDQNIARAGLNVRGLENILKVARRSAGPDRIAELERMLIDAQRRLSLLQRLKVVDAEAALRSES